MAKIPLHPHIDNPGFDNLFKIGSTELDQHIGKKVHFKRKDGSVMTVCVWDAEAQEVIDLGIPEVFNIGSVQRIYDGSLAFRIYETVGQSNGFGRPARPSEVIFI